MRRSTGRNPSRTMPSDRAPDTKPSRDGSGVKTDTFALKPRELSDTEREWERYLVRLCIGRVRVVDDPHETAYVRALLRSMLLGDA